MKKYIKPKFEIIELSSEDIIRTSGEIIDEAAPKSTVGGVDAISYGAQDFNIFSISK